MSVRERVLVWSAGLSLLFVTAGGTASAQVAANRPDPAWFSDAKFGMFIHFGLYSIPAGEWNGEQMGRNWYAEWIRMQHGFPDYNSEGGVGIPRKEYDSLLGRFNPESFDADEWIGLAKSAGMKYFLITAKHHDGFALWPSKVSGYNVVDATPFGRDILGELAEACDKHDVALGFYYSHWQDWGHRGGALPPWPTGNKRWEREPTVKQPTQEEFERYWNSVALPQVVELIENHDPKFWWFDNWRETEFLTERRLDQLIALVRERSPHSLINSRIGVTWNHPAGDELADFLSMGDNQFPSQTINRVWETSGTMQRSWGYHKSDPFWMPVPELLRHLVDNASRGGNYQLNIGPMGDGSFPKASVRRLREIGSWMDINGEAIHGARPVAVPEPGWGRLTGKPVADAYRVYACVYNWPKDRTLIVPELGQAPRRSFLLETGYNVESRVVAGADVVLTVPLDTPPDTRVTVIVMEYDRDPLQR
ncbi:MAG: alpha-L-fucosidase [Planctomycetota bacterium]